MIYALFLVIVVYCAWAIFKQLLLEYLMLKSMMLKLMQSLKVPGPEPVNSILYHLVILSGLLLPLSLAASTQGELEDTSTGTVIVSLSILPSIQLQDVENLRLNITDRKSDNHFEQSFCVTGNKYGKYTITAIGSGQNLDQFLLFNESVEELPYSVGYMGDPSSGAFDQLRPGIPSRVYEVTPFNEGCEKSASFKISFLSTDLTRVNSGLYTGQLTLTVSPI